VDVFFLKHGVYNTS